MLSVPDVRRKISHAPKPRSLAPAGADLLVVGARGVRHLLLGSVADGALNRCPVPVLVVR